MTDKGFRLNTDIRSEKIGAKIRDAENSKIPYMLIVGEKELKDESVSVRRHKMGDMGTSPFKEFLDKVISEVNEYALPPEPGQ